MKSKDTPSGAVLGKGQGKGEGEYFKNRFEALQWLQSRGKISMGKFYQDCKAGHVTIYPDKTVSKFSVAMYAEKHFAGFTRQGPVHSSGESTLIQKGNLPMPEQSKINAAVKVTMESGGITDWSDQDPSGVFTVHARVMIDFNGPDLQAIINRLSSLDPEQVEAASASAVTSSLVALLGPDIAEGGVYVQD
jgi:hypothetical protein